MLLLGWINASIPSIEVHNFTTDWNDGLRLSVLVDYCKPGLIPDHALLDGNYGLSNLQKAMAVAEEELGVPQLMSPEDLAAERPDELSVMTYLSGFCQPGLDSLLEWVQTKIPNTPLSNFSTDWADGRALGALVHSLSEGGFPEFEQMSDEEGRKNCQEAMEAAEKLLGVSKTLSPQDFASTDMHVLTRSTYISQIRFAKLLTEKKQVLQALLVKAVFFGYSDAVKQVGAILQAKTQDSGTPKLRGLDFILGQNVHLKEVITKLVDY